MESEISNGRAIYTITTRKHYIPGKKGDNITSSLHVEVINA